MQALATLIMMVSTWTGTIIVSLLLGFLYPIPWYGIAIFAGIWHWGGYFLAVALAIAAEK